MARHLNLLASLARAPTPGAQGLHVATVPLVLGGVVLAAAAAAAWSHLSAERLARMAAAAQAAPESPTGAARLDPTVVAALERQVRDREALARALTGDARGHEAPAPASRWLEALADAALPGVSVNTVRLEPGPRLSLAGAARQPADINGFIARLQAHPLSGTAAIGQLEMRRGESAGDALSFRLTPPPPEGWTGHGAPSAVSTGESLQRPIP